MIRQDSDKNPYVEKRKLRFDHRILEIHLQEGFFLTLMVPQEGIAIKLAPPGCIRLLDVLRECDKVINTVHVSVPNNSNLTVPISSPNRSASNDLSFPSSITSSFTTFNSNIGNNFSTVNTSNTVSSFPSNNQIQMIYSKRLALNGGTIFIDVARNIRGRVIKLTQIDPHGYRSTLLLAIDSSTMIENGELLKMFIRELASMVTNLNTRMGGNNINHTSSFTIDNLNEPTSVDILPSFPYFGPPYPSPTSTSPHGPYGNPTESLGQVYLPKVPSIQRIVSVGSIKYDISSFTDSTGDYLRIQQSNTPSLTIPSDTIQTAENSTIRNTNVLLELPVNVLPAIFNVFGEYMYLLLQTFPPPIIEQLQKSSLSAQTGGNGHLGYDTFGVLTTSPFLPSVSNGDSSTPNHLISTINDNNNPVMNLSSFPPPPSEE